MQKDTLIKVRPPSKCGAAIIPIFFSAILGISILLAEALLVSGIGEFAKCFLSCTCLQNWSYKGLDYIPGVAEDLLDYIPGVAELDL